MPSRRLTRREIVQESRVEIILNRVYEWILDNTRLLLMGAGLLILVVGGGYAWQQYQAAQLAELQAQFGDALQIFNARLISEDEAEVPEDHSLVDPHDKYRFTTAAERDEKAAEAFRRIAEAKPRSILGQLSHYYLGLIKYRSSQREEALSTVEETLNLARDSEVRNLARNFLARAALDQGDHETAIRYLSEIVQDPISHFPKQTILMRLAESHERQGEPEKALERYRQIVDEFPETETSRQAQTRVDLLEARKAALAEGEP